jgi:cytochrome P450
MSEALPPRPARPPAPDGRIRALLQLLRLAIRSSLSLFYDASFRLDIGRVRLPTLPFFRRRWFLTVRSPDLAREVLVRRPDDYRKSLMMDYMLRDLTGDNLFVSHGDAWRRQRRLMDPAFAQASLKTVFPLMQAACEATVERLAQGASQAPGKAADIDGAMTHFASDVIFRTMFSEAISEADAEAIFAAFETFQKVSYAQGMLSFVRIPAGLVPGAARARRAALRIRAILEAPLKRRLEAIAAGAPHPEADILAVLLKAADPVTRTRLGPIELLDQIAIVFLAGHETTASALAWTTWLLAAYPKVQAELLAEANTVRPGRPAAWGDVRRLALTRDVFRETLRLYPPVAFFARDAVADGCLAGREAPKGSVVVIAPWLLHRHPGHWDAPDAFDPHRFATPNGEEGLRCAYMPFSLGERACIGAAFALQEATLLITALVERFEISLEPGHTPEPIGRLTLRSGNGVRVRLRERLGR